MGSASHAVYALALVFTLTRAYPVLTRLSLWPDHREEAMAKRRLTKLIVEGIKPADNDIVLWDEALPGFGVRVKV